MGSAQERPEVVCLGKECVEDRVQGPLDPGRYPAIHVSRFGVIPKGSTGKWCLIVDLSAPEGWSVNDGIRGEWCFLSYVMQWLCCVDWVRGGHTKCISYSASPHLDDRSLLGMI